MTSRTRRRLFHGVSVLLALGLLYLAFRSVDLQQVATAFRAADYRWLAPVVVLLIGANVLRAWRWQIMVAALPPDAVDATDDEAGDAAITDDAAITVAESEPGASVSSPSAPHAPFGDTFGALMVGYMVNYIAPRMGEVARTMNLSAQTRLRFSSLFGTVVSERILDTVVLMGAVTSAFVLLLDRLPLLHDAVLAPFIQRMDALPVVRLVGTGAAVVVGLAALGYASWRVLRRQQSFLRTLWRGTIQPALVSFRDGMLTLVRSPQRGALLLSTVGMWAGYLLLAYVPFHMLGLAGPYDISLLDAWILMAIGALGLLVPAPGGLGSYHYITIVALGLFYNVPEAEAATYAVLTHAAQMIFYTLAGLVALAFQGASGRRALRTAQRTEEPSVS